MIREAIEKLIWSVKMWYIKKTNPKYYEIVYKEIDKVYHL